MQIEQMQCPLCGVRGLHACLGIKQKGMTPEQRATFDAQLSEAIRNIKAQRSGDEKINY